MIYLISCFNFLAIFPLRKLFDLEKYTINHFICVILLFEKPMCLPMLFITINLIELTLSLYDHMLLSLKLTMNDLSSTLTSLVEPSSN